MNYIVMCAMFFWSTVAYTQTATFHGQLSGWVGGNVDRVMVSQAGLRYIPELFVDHPVTDGILANVELSFNTYGTFQLRQQPEIKLKPYRAWLRMSSDRFETRVGLQKINFGSATLFRPLMWFDAIDPRDPLGLTGGVYGVLMRYYFQNNANIWLWGLWGNNELKGWETVPTKDNTIEFGGRAQTPLLAGEAGVTYHYRRGDLAGTPLVPASSVQRYCDENRLAFDGKWDIEVGVWCEGALIHRSTDVSFMKYQTLATVGVDYTFALGNGLHVLTEVFNTNTSQKVFGAGAETSVVGISADYPIGLLDHVSGFYYRDWTHNQDYFTFNWQRTYDDWAVYLIGFVNPANAALTQTQAGSGVLAGNGFQVLVVFNH